VTDPAYDIPEDEFSFRDLVSEAGLEPDSAGPSSGAVPAPAVPSSGAVPAPAVPLSGAVPAPAVPPNATAPSEPAGSAELAAAPSERGPEAPPQALHQTSISPRHQVEAWLAMMVKEQASDLILRAGGRPSLRVDGGIRFLPGSVPGPGPMKEVLEGILGPRRWAEWNESGSADSAIQLDGLGRFRINAYRQMGEPAMVIRRVNEEAPSLEGLGLPAAQLQQLAMRRRGLVFVTGVAGSGKSTTLAGMIDHLNHRVERHVVTLEDPVELLFREDRCVISQREVGTDTTSFSDGLRHALRQSPDVILIGEVRDATTVVAALEATETGHLVMSTMHTVNAAQTIDRILGFFPAERHRQIRQRLADNLAGVLSQRLVPAREGGMVPAYELLVPTPHVRELVEEGETTELAKVVETSTEDGIVSFNRSLLRLVKERVVELDDALAASDRPDELLMGLRGIRGSADRSVGAGPPSGPESSGGSGLRLAK
jgi:pilus retraction protein PilT